MEIKLNDLYDQLDDLLSDKDMVPAGTASFLANVKKAAGSAQRAIVAEMALPTSVPDILHKGKVDVYKAFINTLFDVAGLENMNLGEPIERVSNGNPEYQEACNTGNLALVALSEIANKIQNPDAASELKERLVAVMHPVQIKDDARPS